MSPRHLELTGGFGRSPFPDGEALTFTTSSDASGLPFARMQGYENGDPRRRFKKRLWVSYEDHIYAMLIMDVHCFLLESEWLVVFCCTLLKCSVAVPYVGVILQPSETAIL